MARVTVEDCLGIVKNHFELILVAALRAKEILNGQTPDVARGNSTVAVVSLREIAENKVDIEKARNGLLDTFSIPTTASHSHQENDNTENDKDQDHLVIEDDKNLLLAEHDDLANEVFEETDVVHVEEESSSEKQDKPVE